MEKSKIKAMFEENPEEQTLTSSSSFQKNHPAFQNNTRVYNVDDLIPSDKNKGIFDLKDIDSKAASILENGLLQMPRVKPIENSKQATILAGHKRIAACKKLVSEGHEEFQFIRCEIDNRDELRAERVIIDTNLETSKLSTFELMQAVGRKAELIQQERSEKGLEGRTVDIIAENSYLERTQVGYYLKCYKKLGEVAKTALRENRITLKEAIQLADEDEPTQVKVIVDMKSNYSDFATAYNHVLKKINHISDLTSKQKQLIVKAFKYRHPEPITFSTSVADLKEWLGAFRHSGSNYIDLEIMGSNEASPAGWRFNQISDCYIKWTIILDVLKEELKDEIEKDEKFYHEIEESMIHHLQTSVSVKPDKIEISYKGKDDFNRILECLNLLEKSLQ